MANIISAGMLKVGDESLTGILKVTAGVLDINSTPDIRALFSASSPITITDGKIALSYTGNLRNNSNNLDTIQDIGTGSNPIFNNLTTTKTTSGELYGNIVGANGRLHAYGTYQVAAENANPILMQTKVKNDSKAYNSSTTVWIDPQLDVKSPGSYVQSVALRVEGGSLVNGGIITNAYGVHITRPNFGTNKTALYADDISVGYTGTSTPTNGVIVSGKLGVGTTNPSRKVEIVTMHSGQDGIRLQGTTTNLNVIMRNSTTYTNNYPMALTYNAGFRALLFQALDNTDESKVIRSPMFITYDGNVGIGNTNPTEQLHVTGNIKSTGQLYATHLNLSDGGIELNHSANVPYIDFKDNTDDYRWRIMMNSSDNFSIQKQGGGHKVIVTSPNTQVTNSLLVADDGDTIHATARLQVNSTTKGFMPPAMTDANTNTLKALTPPNGMMVYNTEKSALVVADKAKTSTASGLTATETTETNLTFYPISIGACREVYRMLVNNLSSSNSSSTSALVSEFDTIGRRYVTWMGAPRALGDQFTLNLPRLYPGMYRIDYTLRHQSSAGNWEMRLYATGDPIRSVVCYDTNQTYYDYSDYFSINAEDDTYTYKWKGVGKEGSDYTLYLGGVIRVVKMG